MVDIPLSDFRKTAIEEVDRSKQPKHAAQQATALGYDKFPIVDGASHHYELESLDQILDYMDDPVLQQLARSATQSGGSKGTGVLPGGVGYQDIGGRALRSSGRKLEEGPGGEARRTNPTRRRMGSSGPGQRTVIPS